MAKCTREQVERWEAKLSSGFQFDLRYFLLWGEKQATKNIDLPEGKILQAKVSWYEDRQRMLYPALHLSIWSPGNVPGVYSSQGMGASIPLSEQRYTKKNWNELAKFTQAWDDTRIKSEAKKHFSELMKEEIA